MPVSSLIWYWYFPRTGVKNFNGTNSFNESNQLDYSIFSFLNLMQMRICWHPVTSVLQIRICDQPTINKKMREFYTPSLVSTPCYSIQNFLYPKFSFYTLDNIPRFPHEKEERRGRSLILSPESHKNSCRCWPLSDVRSTDNGSHSPERAQSRENFTKKNENNQEFSVECHTHENSTDLPNNTPSTA